MLFQNPLSMQKTMPLIMLLRKCTIAQVIIENDTEIVAINRNNLNEKMI